MALKRSMMAAARKEMRNDTPAPSSGLGGLMRATSNIGVDCWASLRKAAANGDADCCLGILTAEGMSVNAADSEGITPLMVAVERGNHSLVSALIEQKADVNATDNNGRTAFDMAMPSAGPDVAAAGPPATESLPPELLAAVSQALYAVVRHRPTDKTPCQYMAMHLRQGGLPLPHPELVEPSTNTELPKPIGVSSNEMNVALELFGQFDVDSSGTLQVEEAVLLVLRLAERIAGGFRPSQPVSRV